MDEARREAAKVLGVKESAVQVATLDESVAGVTVVGATAGGDRGPRKFAPAAVLADGKVVVGGDAVRKALFGAWAWAPGKVPADQVAAVITKTLETDEPAKLVSDPDRVAYLKRLGVDGVSLPHEDTLDGRPAVVWWIQTGSNPATEVLLKVGADGVPTVSYGRTHGGG